MLLNFLFFCNSNLQVFDLCRLHVVAGTVIIGIGIGIGIAIAIAIAIVGLWVAREVRYLLLRLL